MKCARCNKALKAAHDQHLMYGQVFGPECIKKVTEVQEFEKTRNNIKYTKLYCKEQKRLRAEYLKFYEDTAWKNRAALDNYDDSTVIFESLKSDFLIARIDFWQGLLGMNVRDTFIALYESKLAAAGISA